ncbi:hypothetical protein Droror1_Dr00015982 [Drosera rotundifolia]
MILRSQLPQQSHQSTVPLCCRITIDHTKRRNIPLLFLQETETLPQLLLGIVLRIPSQKALNKSEIATTSMIEPRFWTSKIQYSESITQTTDLASRLQNATRVVLQLTIGYSQQW